MRSTGAAGKRIVFLTHRLPYAPNRGDRIRAYHELRTLAARHEVHLISLVHDEDERSHDRDLQGLAASVTACPVRTWTNRLRALPAMASSRPLTHVLLDSPEIRPALESVVRDARPDLVVAYCSSMARFALEPPLAGVPFTLDMVDVDSAKWKTLAEVAKAPRSLVYAREARVLSRFEVKAARLARATFVVNDREAEALHRLTGNGPRVEVMENGVDLELLHPPGSATASHDVVFCGVMNYAPNEEAAVWLAREVWPLVRAREAKARLILLGATPSARVRSLESATARIVVTGSVADVRPHLWNAAVSAAPLRVARGIQNKVLEALAAGLPVVVTPVVAEGLPTEVVDACTVAESAADFAAALVALLSHSPAERRAVAQRAHLEDLGWERRLAPLLRAVDDLAE